jgi:hypothetical protein
MKINKETAALVSEIEYIIGNECYNPNSYDGYTGEEGRGFRYPVIITVRDEKGNAEDCKTRSRLHNNIIHDFKPNDLIYAKYKFGSNHLYICQGIQKALTFLEKRYNISFEELEKKFAEEQDNGQA